MIVLRRLSITPQPTLPSHSLSYNASFAQLKSSRTVQFRNANFQFKSNIYNINTQQVNTTLSNAENTLNQSKDEKNNKTGQNATQKNNDLTEGITNDSFSSIFFDLMHSVVKLGYNSHVAYGDTLKKLPILPIQFIASLTSFLQLEGIIRDYNLIKNIKYAKKKSGTNDKSYLNFAIELNFDNYVQTATLVMLILHSLETHPKFVYFIEGYTIHLLISPSMKQYYPLLQETFMHPRVTLSLVEDDGLYAYCNSNNIHISLQTDTLNDHMNMILRNIYNDPTYSIIHNPKVKELTPTLYSLSPFYDTTMSDITHMFNEVFKLPNLTFDTKNNDTTRKNTNIYSIKHTNDNNHHRDQHQHQSFEISNSSIDQLNEKLTKEEQNDMFDMLFVLRNVAKEITMKRIASNRSLKIEHGDLMMQIPIPPSIPTFSSIPDIAKQFFLPSTYFYFEYLPFYKFKETKPITKSHNLRLLKYLKRNYFVEGELKLRNANIYYLSRTLQYICELFGVDPSDQILYTHLEFFKHIQNDSEYPFQLTFPSNSNRTIKLQYDPILKLVHASSSPSSSSQLTPPPPRILQINPIIPITRIMKENDQQSTEDTKGGGNDNGFPISEDTLYMYNGNWCVYYSRSTKSNHKRSGEGRKTLSNNSEIDDDSSDYAYNIALNIDENDENNENNDEANSTELLESLTSPPPPISNVDIRVRLLNADDLKDLASVVASEDYIAKIKSIPREKLFTLPAFFNGDKLISIPLLKLYPSSNATVQFFCIHYSYP